MLLSDFLPKDISQKLADAWITCESWHYYVENDLMNHVDMQDMCNSCEWLTVLDAYTQMDVIRALWPILASRGEKISFWFDEYALSKSDTNPSIKVLEWTEWNTYDDFWTYLAWLLLTKI